MKPNMRFFSVYLGLIAIFSIGVASLQAQCTTNIAFGKQASASTIASGNNPGDAIDGNGSSRWESVAADPQHLDIDLGDLYNICRVEVLWENASASNFTIQVSNDGFSWSTVASVTGNTIYTNVFTVSTSGRYVRMAGTTRTTGYGYSIYEFRVFGALASGVSCPTLNLANGLTGMASSVGNPGNSIANAFDNNLGTRWESLSMDPQWIYIDLGARYDLCQVKLNWEAAYGRTYHIDFSNDALSWTTVRSVPNNTSLINIIPLTGVARYVRVYGTARATTFGYSLYEFQAFGSLNVLPVKLEYFRARPSGKMIVLEWASQHEVSSAWFEIQRSSTEQSGFVSVGRVVAAGNTQGRTTYSFTDAAAPTGKNYYRLKQTDIDGAVTYSPIAAAFIEENEGPDKLVTAIYDRGNDELQFKTASRTGQPGAGIGQRLNARVYTVDGKLLANTNDLSRSIPMHSFGHGIYIVLINADGRLVSARIMK